MTKLRIRILLYEKPDYTIHYLVELVHLLQQAGHDAGFADKVICDLRMNVNRIARFVESRKADAWVVAAGSKELLEWFATQPKPAFALFGRLMHVLLGICFLRDDSERAIGSDRRAGKRGLNSSVPIMSSPRPGGC